MLLNPVEHRKKQSEVKSQLQLTRIQNLSKSLTIIIWSENSHSKVMKQPILLKENLSLLILRKSESTLGLSDTSDIWTNLTCLTKLAFLISPVLVISWDMKTSTLLVWEISILRRPFWWIECWVKRIYLVALLMDEWISHTIHSFTQKASLLCTIAKAILKYLMIKYQL